MEIVAIIGSCIGELRQPKNLTQNQLGTRSGSDPSMIQKIENGHSLRPRNIMELAAVLEVNPAWLMFGDKYASREVPEDA